eukprot:TRINITY_DN1573_c0_g1_i2.p1 TRINITY_DN1573_c0_g1~~TRINITY_DN1573_c0_g1_i2.p1  ORF type:complete len:286 (-),score=103.28 TRINITY_DN1573_c0_g1_i2:38-895(-)
MNQVGLFEEDMQKLEGLGFRRPKQNAKLLRKFKSVEKVIEVLMEKSNMKEQRKQERRNRKRGMKENQEVQGNEPATEERKKKERKERKEKEPVASFTEWPASVTHLYLDGNNMMFLTGSLRSYTLGRKRSKAEDGLTAISEAFAKAMREKGLKKTLMIYDHISQRRCYEKQIEGDLEFVVCTARPTFTTSDDALVAMAQKCSPELCQRSLYVTSDRGLRERLVATGSLVMKPKEWLRFVMETLQTEQSMDDFIHTWISKCEKTEEGEEGDERRNQNGNEIEIEMK